MAGVSDFLYMRHLLCIFAPNSLTNLLMSLLAPGSTDTQGKRRNGRAYEFRDLDRTVCRFRGIGSGRRKKTRPSKTPRALCVLFSPTDLEA